ncbi:MAG: hypothetical protein IPJ19_07430 [Planctomycetes bacterium]|nr:hypothetical protein [Planctomycetota bacterium]
MTRQASRLQFLRTFTTAAVLTLGAGSLLGAAAPDVSGPCTCRYEPGALESSAPPPPGCGAAAGMHTIIAFEPNQMHDGSCSKPGCSPNNCTGNGMITVAYDGNCSITVFNSTGPIARGMSIVTFWVHENLECGGFAEYTAQMGSFEIYRITNVCWPCMAGN